MRVRCTRPAIAASLWLASCNSVDQTTVRSEETGTGAAPPAGLNESRATVAAGTVVSGFKHGQLRREIEVEAFAISQLPITVGQYRTCMDANVCTTPVQDCANFSGKSADGSGSDSESAAREDAALCVGEQNARAYCTWSGGRLPVLSEWMLAARGPSPRRFSWGDGSPTCQQHPLARDRMLRSSVANTGPAGRAPLEALSEGAVLAQAECAETDARRFEVGKHSAGASPSGLQDVLIAEGELLGGQQGSHFTACARSDRGCIVYGLLPGAMDAVKPTDEARRAASSQAYTFRCAWSTEGS